MKKNRTQPKKAKSKPGNDWMHAGVILVTIALMAIIGLHEPPFWPVIPTAAVAAMAAPFFSLFMAAFAGNKVEGLAVMKGAGIFLIADRPVRIGDRVKSESIGTHWGGWGDVADVGLRRR